MISIIRFRNALFGDAFRQRTRTSTRSTQVLVEPSTFDNPAFLQPQTIEEVSLFNLSYLINAQIVLSENIYSYLQITYLPV